MRANELGDALGAERQGAVAMTDQVIRFLLDVVFGLFTYALLLRFAMQWLRAPFRNPLGQAVIALTDWIVKPLRRVLPGWKGVDWASLLALFLFQFLWLLAYNLVFGGFSLPARACLPAGRDGDRTAEGGALAADRRRVRAGDPVVGGAGRPAVRIAQRADVSVPAPIRRIMPPIGGTLDLSPLIVIVIAQLALMTIVPWLESALTKAFL